MNPRSPTTRRFLIGITIAAVFIVLVATEWIERQTRARSDLHREAILDGVRAIQTEQRAAAEQRARIEIMLKELLDR